MVTNDKDNKPFALDFEDRQDYRIAIAALELQRKDVLRVRMFIMAEKLISRS